MVATDVKKTYSNEIKTYQYSAKDIQRTISSGELNNKLSLQE